ncbi:MAG: type IV pilus secretin PilQ [Methylococcales symbiont of Hymedesmia sp. n. MRB-2018]|nr:MAG: type IV pilus secretin PilQ [Methylococcales symbiont of Hymedesmia sp. n. MRB-2018]
MQKNKIIRLQKISSFARFSLGLMMLLTQISIALANETAITDLSFYSLAGDKVQIQLTMNGTAIAPKVFQTDNPARIALDFLGVKSALEQKMYTVNQGVANSVFVVEASGITRVVINLTETVPFETKVVENNVYLILKPIDVASSPKNSHEIEQVDRSITQLLPEQTIKAIDFRRGAKGEGRLLLELSSANTVVDIKQRGGKLVLNFLNTKLPDALAKSYDVSDFATPVQKVEAKKRGSGVSISITPKDGKFDYSSYQSDGLLTVDFSPLTAAEKEALLKEKFPYTGDKLSLNFQDIEVRAVLQILADFTNINIIAADSVEGTVTLRLNDVPWDQALDLILKSNGLAKRQTGNVISIAPFSEIIKIEEEELAANKVVKQLESLKTEYIQINYAKAEKIQMLLTGSSVVESSSKISQTKESTIFGGSNTTENRVRLAEKSDAQGVLSLRGSSSVDSRTNTIIVKDTVEQLEEIRKMIKILDVPVRQVMIEARIVIANTNFAQEIGIKFGVAKGNSVYGQLFPNVLADENYLVDLGASAIRNHPAGALGITLAKTADYVLNLELSALENENKGEVLANPRVMTSDRELAFIKQGVQIPFETVSEKGTQIELIDAVLELNVTPQITPDGDVIMELLIKKDAPNATGGIDKREIETLVRVSDGETVVLGGVYEGDVEQEEFKIPFFGDLPGVGFLFKKKTRGESKRELLIFVTPKIVKSSLSVR